MCACKLKQVGYCCYGHKPALVSHAKLHSSASGNDERAISVTHHELLLLGGLSQGAPRLQEKSAVSWSAMLMVRSAGQGRECALSQHLLLSLCDQFREARCLDISFFLLSLGHLKVRSCLAIQLIRLNGPCWRGSPHPACLALPILLPPLQELAFTWTRAEPGKELDHPSPKNK